MRSAVLIRGKWSSSGKLIMLWICISGRHVWLWSCLIVLLRASLLNIINLAKCTICMHVLDVSMSWRACSGTEFVTQMHNVRLYVGSLQGLYGGFLKWGDLQIIHFNRIFHYKPSTYWDFPIYGHPHHTRWRNAIEHWRCFSAGALGVASYQLKCLGGDFWSMFIPKDLISD